MNIEFGKVVNDAMDMIQRFLQSDEVCMLMFHNSDSRGLILRGSAKDIKVLDRVILDVLSDRLWNLRRDWDVLPMPYGRVFRFLYREMTGGEFLDWAARTKPHVGEDVLNLINLMGQDSEVKWSKVVYVNTSDKSIIYYDEFIISKRPKTPQPRRKELWKTLAVVASSVIASAILDYLIVTRGLFLLPPLGFFLPPGAGLLAALEVCVIDALIMGAALWLLGFSGRASIIIATAFGIVYALSMYASIVIDTYVTPSPHALQLMTNTAIGMLIGLIGMAIFMGIASKEYDP